MYVYDENDAISFVQSESDSKIKEINKKIEEQSKKVDLIEELFIEQMNRKIEQEKDNVKKEYDFKIRYLELQKNEAMKKMSEAVKCLNEIIDSLEGENKLSFCSKICYNYCENCASGCCNGFRFKV